MKKSDFEYVLSLLRQYAGWDLSNDKYFIIDKKLYNFICEKGYASVEDLIAELKIGQKAMLWQVVEALTLSDTYFYRDYPVFKAFENYLLPQLREINRSSKKLRIWSLGCSTGQEAYSIAMAVKHKLLGVKDWNVNIIGTDISSYSIGKAQKGLFSQFDVQMGLNMRQILENFHQDQGQWQLNDDILSMVEFRRYNLMDELTLSGSYDVIFCRYVLQYFSPEIQRKIVAKIYSRQNPAGFLYTGMHENIRGLDEFYQSVSGMDCLYQVKMNVPLPNFDEDVKSEVIAGPADSDDDIPSFVRPRNLTYRAPQSAQDFMEELKKKN